MRQIDFKNLLFLTTAFLFLTSCLDFRGKLVVNNSMVVQEKKKTKIIPPGVYSAKLAVKSKKKIKITVENSGFKESAVIKISSGYQIPEYDGTFKIPASAIGQSFSIEGNKVSTVHRSPTVREKQHCTIARNFRKCERVCEVKTIRLPDGKIRKKRVCKDVCRTITRHLPGRKNIVYHHKTVNQKIDMTAVDSSSLAKVADYSGHNSYTTTIHEHIGLCRLLHPRRVRRY